MYYIYRISVILIDLVVCYLTLNAVGLCCVCNVSEEMNENQKKEVTKCQIGVSNKCIYKKSQIKN